MAFVAVELQTARWQCGPFFRRPTCSTSDRTRRNVPSLYSRQIHGIVFIVKLTTMKTVFVTVGTTSFDELITTITTPEAVKVSSTAVLKCY